LGLDGHPYHPLKGGEMTTNSKAKIHTVYKTKDGERVPSVTTILGILNKPALLEWAWKCGCDGLDYKAIRDQTADIGKLAHYMVMCHLLEQKTDTSEYSAEDIDKAENSFLKYLEWEKQHDVEPILVESALVSENYKFGGQIDCYCRLDGSPTLIDFKTGKAIYPEYFHQLAAYEMLLSENGYEVDQSRILRIGRNDDEGFEDRFIGKLDKHWELFLNCQRVYELQKELRRDK